MAGDPAEAYVTYGRFTVFAAALVTIVVIPLMGVAWSFWEIRGDFFNWRESADYRIDGYENQIGDLRMEVLSLCQHIETLHRVRGHGCPRILPQSSESFSPYSPALPVSGEADTSETDTGIGKG